jgi:hypothetical protein
MPTPLGIMFFVATIYCFVRSSGSLFSLLIFSSLFQAGSVINIGTLGIQPFYFVGCFFIMRTFLGRSIINVRSEIFRGKTALLLFSALAVFSAFTLPFFFQGIPVYDPKVGVDFFIRPPLKFGLGNVAQAGYLGLEVCVVLAAGAQREDLDKFLKTFWVSFYFLSAVIFTQFLCQHIGVAFPSSIFANNPSYYIEDTSSGQWSSRVMGTFSEPSLVGGVLAMFTVGLISKVLGGERKLTSLVIAVIDLAMVRSSSAVASVTIVTFFLVLNFKVYKFPWYIKTDNFKRLLTLIFVGILAIGAIIASPLRESLFSQTVDKSDSASFLYRTTADLYSLLLTGETYGLGVGLGSNRPSSLLATVVSNTGILGLGLFVAMVCQLMRNTKNATWVRWAGVTLFIDLVLSGPDITFPPMWIFLAILARIGTANGLSRLNRFRILHLREERISGDNPLVAKFNPSNLK